MAYSLCEKLYMNEKNLPKIIVICGPTATGKSALAVEIAKAVNGEIISADSRQVYKGMDLGTGKVTVQEMAGIPHHLLDVAEPSDTFTVSLFKEQTDMAIRDIVSRGKTPILCGGTGLYIDAVASGMRLPPVEANPELRAELQTKTREELYAQLAALDPERAQNIDALNPVRLMRAIEVATAIGIVPKITYEKPYETLFIGLDMDDETLKARIRTRLTERMDAGMLEEVRGLHAAGLSHERLFSLGLEYRYLGLFMEEKITLPEMLAQLEMEIWHYAKRQRTWFKRNKEIIWLDPLKEADRAKAIDLSKKFIF